MKAVTVEMRSDQVNILKVRPKVFPDGLYIRCESCLKSFDLRKWKDEFC